MLFKDSSKIICLICCSKDKDKSKQAAKHLYQSKRFRLSKSLAERLKAQWFIVSAKHGLVRPNEVLEPYDFSLNELPANAKKNGQSPFAKTSLLTLQKKHISFVLVIALISVKYATL